MEPGVRALHHPAPRLGPSATLGPDLLATRAQVRGEAELRGEGARLVVVEPLVEAEVLGTAARRPGPSDRDGLKGGAHQLVVVAVGPVDGRPERHAAAVGQHRALHPALAAVGRVAAGFSPRRAAPCPSRRPGPTKSGRCPAARRRPAGPRARTPRRPRPRPTPGSAGAPRRPGRSWSRAAHPTGTPSAARRRSHPSPRGPAPAGCGTPAHALAAAATAAPSRPKAHPAAANHHPEHVASSPCLQPVLPFQIDGSSAETPLLG